MEIVKQNPGVLAVTDSEDILECSIKAKRLSELSTKGCMNI